MYIGVTGQIGSGKTTAAKTLASFGAAVIDADRIGHEVVDKSIPLSKRLARQFGRVATTNLFGVKPCRSARVPHSLLCEALVHEQTPHSRAVCYQLCNLSLLFTPLFLREGQG